MIDMPRENPHDWLSVLGIFFLILPGKEKKNPFLTRSARIFFSPFDFNQS